MSNCCVKWKETPFYVLSASSLRLVVLNNPPPLHPLSLFSLFVSCLTSLLLLRLETLSFDTLESNGQTLLVFLYCTPDHDLAHSLSSSSDAKLSVISAKCDYKQRSRSPCGAVVLMALLRKDTLIIAPHVQSKINFYFHKCGQVLPWPFLSCRLQPPHLSADPPCNCTVLYRFLNSIKVCKHLREQKEK